MRRNLSEENKKALQDTEDTKRRQEQLTRDSLGSSHELVSHGLLPSSCNGRELLLTVFGLLLLALEGLSSIRCLLFRLSKDLFKSVQPTDSSIILICSMPKTLDEYNNKLNALEK